MIDAHHHLWQLERDGCSWPTPKLRAIYRSFELEEFLPLAQAEGVSGSVLVQSQACDVDTDYLLQLADHSDFIKAVVGWVDLAAGNAPARIAQLTQVSSAGRPSKLRSLRPMLQDLTDKEWILRPQLAPAIKAIKAHGLAFDALVTPDHLPALYQFARRHPDLPVVINHGAKPAIIAHSQPAAEWCNAMAAMASLPNVYCKLSGLSTLAGVEQSAAVFNAYIARLCELFGCERLMWGSDWPVLGMAANPHWSTYAGWLGLVREALPCLAVNEIEQIFTTTCARFYHIT